MAIDRSVGAQYAQLIIDLYGRVERELAEVIASKVRRGLAHDDLSSRLLALTEIRRSAEAAMRKIDGKLGPAVERALVEAAAAGGRKAQEDLLRLRDRRAVGRRLVDVDKNLINSPSILRLAATLAPGLERRLASTHLQVVRSAGDIYQHAVAAVGAAGVLAGASTRREAAQKALDHLWQRGITGFVDRAGRNWNLASYVEMATRTTTAQAAVQGHLDQLAQQGMDLVMVSADGAPCPVCRPWEGKILTTGSASGPQVVQRASEIDGSTVSVHIDGSTSEAIGAGLFHPSCRHRFITYLPGLTSPIETAGDGAATYVVEQRQRAMERDARRLAVQSAGAVDPAAAKRCAAAYRAKRAQIKAHVDANPQLRRKTERERIDLGHAPSGKVPAPAPPPPAPKPKPEPPPPGPPREEGFIPTVDASAPGVQKYQELGLYVNEELRGTAASKMQRIPKETSDKIISDLDETFRQAGLTRGTNIVYRGLNEPESLKTMQERALFGDESAVGKEFTDKGYGSTTDSAGAAESFAGFGGGKTVIEITLPQGSSALKFKGNLERESEVLLNRDYTLKITHDDMGVGDDGVRRMKAVLMPKSPVAAPAPPKPKPASAPAKRAARATTAAPKPKPVPRGIAKRVASIPEGVQRVRVGEALGLQAAIAPNSVEALRNVRPMTDADKTQHGMDNSVAAYYWQREIVVGPHIYSKTFDGTAKYCQSSGWWVKAGDDADALKAVFSHEFGHHVHAMLDNASSAERLKFWQTVGDEISSPFPRGYTTSRTDVDSWISRNKSEVEHMISKYGSTDSREMLAEIWCEYTANKNARPWIKKIGAEMKRIAEANAA